MSELLKSYDNAAGRTCEVRYDTARYPRPFWVDARAAMKLCATYPSQEEAEHAAAHFMATGDLPAAAEGSGVPSPKPGIDKNAPKNALPPQGGTSTHPAPETHFATPLQRQGAPLPRRLVSRGRGGGSFNAAAAVAGPVKRRVPECQFVWGKAFSVPGRGLM